MEIFTHSVYDFLDFILLHGLMDTPLEEAFTHGLTLP